MKETRFFLDKSYPVSGIYHVSQGIHLYERYFCSCINTSIRLEATPDYLYSPSTAKWLKSAIEDIRIIFILRDPLDRFLSWYRFAKQNCLIANTMSVDEFIARQQTQHGNPPQHLRALEQGRYGRYISEYLNTFHQDQILVLYYDDLVSCPLNLMKKTCRFLNIDNNIYNNYTFEVINKSLKLKNPGIYGIYKEMGKRVRRYTHDKPTLQKPLRSVRKRLDKYLLATSKSDADCEILSRDSKQRLESYYNEDTELLSELLKDTPPWIHYSNSGHG